MQVRHDYDEPDFATIDTLFSLAEAHLFMQLVELQDANPGILAVNKGYADIYRCPNPPSRQQEALGPTKYIFMFTCGKGLYCGLLEGNAKRNIQELRSQGCNHCPLQALSCFKPCPVLACLTWHSRMGDIWGSFQYFH